MGILVDLKSEIRNFLITNPAVDGIDIAVKLGQPVDQVYRAVDEMISAGQVCRSGWGISTRLYFIAGCWNCANFRVEADSSLPTRYQPGLRFRGYCHAGYLNGCASMAMARTPNFDAPVCPGWQVLKQKEDYQHE